MGAQKSSRLPGTKISSVRTGLQIEDSEINNTVLDFQITSAESQRLKETNKERAFLGLATTRSPQLGLGWLQCMFSILEASQDLGNGEWDPNLWLWLLSHIACFLAACTP